MKKQICLALALTSISVLGVSRAAGQAGSEAAAPLPGYYGRMPWMDGTTEEALVHSAAGTTIPMFTYSMKATKDGLTYSETLAGTSPFGATFTTSNIPVVVVPLKFSLAGKSFDPSAPNQCDGFNSPTLRLMQSPLVANNIPGWVFNGINVGSVQYVNAFRKAEFWSLVQSNPKAYNNVLSFTLAAQVVAPANNGIVYGSGCSLIGIVSQSWLDGYLKNTLMPSLTTSGVINPGQFVVFLTKNVVSSWTNPPSSTTCCYLGYHSAKGSPSQTYSVVEYDTSKLFTGTSDVSVASHEIAEWMDDPLATNLAPVWGNIGQVSGCPVPSKSVYEVGDPLSGVLLPAIGVYHLQELAYFSWFFNAKGTASLGTGGKFSNNGRFSGPAQPCPPGGTF